MFGSLNIFGPCMENDDQEPGRDEIKEAKVAAKKGHMFYVNGVGPVTTEKIPADLTRKMSADYQKDLPDHSNSARSKTKLKAVDIEASVEAGKYFGVGFAFGMCCFFTSRANGNVF